MADGAFTAEGRALRESVEVATDAQCEVILDALGDAFDALLAMLAPVGRRPSAPPAATRRRVRTTSPPSADLRRGGGAPCRRRE